MNGVTVSTSSGGFVAPTTLDEALAALAAGAVPLAGGTDLVVGHRQGKRPLPASIVNLDRVAELRGVCAGADASLVVGALTSHRELLANQDVLSRFTGIADASSIVGSAATRATGTIGGNVMNASPAADTSAPLLCLDAVAVLRSSAGVRRVPLAALFVGPGRTSAAPGELLVSLELPDPGSAAGSSYVRLEYRRHMEIAVVGAGAFVRFDTDGRVVAARVAITALAPTVRLVEAAGAALIGTTADAASIQTAATAAGAAATPISDVRGSAAYRSSMAVVIARRAIETAVTRARGGHVVVPASDSTFGGSAATRAGN
jgi:CO/xanthine dehydrogenase FAD-binding subunit